VKRPKVLLLDEPLSALDAKLRDDMRLELTRLQETVGITFIIVTHDQDEALSMASRIAVMDRGAVQQVATPAQLYEHPRSRFVADFIGKVNLIDARVLRQAGRRIDCEARGLGRLELMTDGLVGAQVAIAVRPEKLKISATEPAGGIRVNGRVRDVAYFGDTSHVLIEAADGLDLSVNVQNESRRGGAGVERGQNVWVHWAPEDSIVLAE
jgi:ABC-type Fe3+/spermidine/putrescine transport system ATPase subunit